MAELPKYQQTGRVFADLPQFDFANVREAFKSSQSMAAGLDRLSDFASKVSVSEAKKAAGKYALDNPLTLEQIKESSKSGITPEKLVAASGGGIAFQETLSELQAEQLKNQLEVKTKDDLIKIKAQVDLLQITDPNEIKAKYEAAISGTGKILGQLNPETQLKYEAQMGAVASAFYKENVETLTKNYKTSQEGLSYTNIQHSLTAGKSMLKVVQDPVMLTEVIQSLGRQVFNQAIEAGPDFAAKQEQDFYKKMQEEKVNYLTKIAVDPAFATDASQAITRIAKGDFKLNDENDYSAIYANESPENQAKIRAYVRQQFIDLNTTNNEIEKNRIDDLKSQVNNIELEYYKTKNPKLLNQLIDISRRSDGKAISASAIEAIKKSADEKEGDLQYTDNIIKMKDEIKRGRYDSLDAMYARGEQLGVSRRSINKFVAPSFLSKADALVDDILDSYADISNPSGSKAAKVRKRIAVQQEVDIAYEAQFNKEGSDTKPKLSKAEIAAKLVDEKIKGNSQKTAKVTTLNSTANKYGLSFTAASTLDELTIQDIDRKVKDKAENASIKKQIKELN